MSSTLRIISAGTPDDLARLRAFVTTRDAKALSELERHLARPRYRPTFTRIAERAGQVTGYALIGHERLRLGVAALDAGRIAALDIGSTPDDPSVFAVLLGDCLRVLVEEGLALATLHGPVADYGSFGFAEYLFKSVAKYWNLDHERHDLLSPVAEADLDECLETLVERLGKGAR